MAVRTNTLLGGLLVAIVVTSCVAIGTAAVGATTSTDRSAALQEDAPASFEDGNVVEQRGDVANFTIQFNDTDRATVTVGSEDVNYLVNFTVVDGDGDGEATVRINTLVAGQESGANESGIEAVGDDEITDYEMTTEPVPGPLDAATYSLELRVDGELADVGSLVLNERSTEGMTVWTAPGETAPNDTSALQDAITQTDRIGQGDWAVLQVEASGLSSYVESADDLERSEYGLNFTLREDPGRNQPERLVEPANLQAINDGVNDQLFVLVDTSDLNVTSEYNATFSVNDSNPLLEVGENESVSATFTVVERNVTFGNLTDGQLELPAESDATVSGTSTAAPGTVMEVSLRTFGENAFLETTEATVADDGSWSATFDLSEASNGTEFVVETDDPSATVSGIVVEANETDTTDETEETTDETETTDEEATTEEGTTADEETATPGEDETETATGDDEATEEVVETTTESDESGHLTAGVGSSLGLTALVVAGALAALRRH